MEPPTKPTFLVLNKQRKHPLDSRAARGFLANAVRELGVADRSFSVVFISDEMMRVYNRDYRGYDNPTDVLSFRGEDENLGDILISSETAHHQAHRSSTLSFQTNLHRLMLHGLLHLMGYDHETDNGEMRTMERRFRRRFQC